MAGLGETGLSKPEGDNLREKGKDLKDQAAYKLGDEGFKKGLTALGIPPQAADAIRRGLNSRVGQTVLKTSIAAQLAERLAPSVMDGALGRPRKKNDKAEASGSASGSGRGKLTMAFGATLPALPVLLIVVILMWLLGGNLSLDDNETEPDDISNRRVAEYFPGDWQRVLQQAARRASSSQPDYAKVPWTVLAGIVKTQTDFARYSPYDNIDRDPGREASQIPTGGDGGGGGATQVGDTRGAGPGPVEGVSGPGSAATVASGHPGPPAGDLSHQLGWFLWALRMHESNGVYTAPAGTDVSDACGAYQYISSTWNNYGGYATACEAPPSVQDRRATRDVLDKWNSYGKWQQVAAAHFYPAWASSPGSWDSCPDGCSFNPTVWEYVDGVMTKMREAARNNPAGATVQPAAVRTGAAGPASEGGDARPGVVADGCPVGNPEPDIGGEDRQGAGPYLLTPGAADDMENMSLDPQNPCDSSFYVARKLAEAAKRVHADPESPRWVPNGTAADQKNARDYWSAVIAASAAFVSRDADPDAPCRVPPPDDRDEPWSVSFKIIYIWRCEIVRMPELYLVTGGEYRDDGEFQYTVEEDRTSATEILVNEALSVSYGVGRWKTKGCDNDLDDRQGVFAMTKQEASEAGVADRCDVEENITGAARLVLSAEKTPPEERPAGHGPFQPMVGGWQKLGIAMGTDLRLFSVIGPGHRFTASEECTRVMTRFLTDLAPHAAPFAGLDEPPTTEEIYGEWQGRMTDLTEANGLSEPGSDRACLIGSRAPGFNATLAQIAVSLAAGDNANDANLNGLAHYYQGKETANQETPPVVGEDTLVIPRLALRPLEEVGAPIAPDATEAWSRLGSTEGVTIPLEQRAVEYAWFFGGVIAPFSSAGERIGSLKTGSGGEGGSGGGQVEVGPDGCPKKAPANTLREGAAAIGIHELCVDSVAQARSPEAAKAIKWALTHLGIPYCMCVPQREWDNYADCSSFVSRAYRSAVPNLYGGPSPTTDTLRAVPWMRQIPFSQVKPGDLVEPHSGHVAMRLASGYKVHTNTTGDVSHVERAYSSAYWAGWFDRGRA